jgi:hypothetical protein
MKCKIKITPRIAKYLTTNNSIANNIKKRTSDKIEIGKEITVNFNNVLYGQFKNLFGEENIVKENINFSEQKLREIIKSIIKEMSTTSNISGYNSKYAFKDVPLSGSNIPQNTGEKI